MLSIGKTTYRKDKIPTHNNSRYNKNDKKVGIILHNIRNKTHLYFQKEFIFSPSNVNENFLLFWS